MYENALPTASHVVNVCANLLEKVMAQDLCGHVIELDTMIY
jgi:hypothetical protein